MKKNYFCIHFRLGGGESGVLGAEVGEDVEGGGGVGVGVGEGIIGRRGTGVEEGGVPGVGVGEDVEGVGGGGGVTIYFSFNF